MLVKVTKDQLVSTDDILFAEADDLDDEKTRVWLRHFPNPITVDVDFDQFVWTLNDAYDPNYSSRRLVQKP